MSAEKGESGVAKEGSVSRWLIFTLTCLDSDGFVVGKLQFSAAASYEFYR